MSATPAPRPELPQRPILGETTPLLAAVLVLAFVGFTSWFWQSEDGDLLDLAPLYILAALFCIDMIFLRNRLHNKSKDMF